MPKEADPNLVELVNALTEFAGIHGVSASGGGEHDTKFGLPSRSWRVFFNLKPARYRTPSLEAWISLEKLAYIFGKLFPSDKGQVRVTAFSSSPYLNGPGESIYFLLESDDADPRTVAGWLNDHRDEIV